MRNTNPSVRSHARGEEQDAMVEEMNKLTILGCRRDELSERDGGRRRGRQGERGSYDR